MSASSRNNPTPPVLNSENLSLFPHFRRNFGHGQFVGQVDVRDGIIVETPPIWRKFRGQKLHKLEWWITRQYGTMQTRRMDRG